MYVGIAILHSDLILTSSIKKMLLVITCVQSPAYLVRVHVSVQHVSENVCVPRGCDMNQFKSIFYTEMTYLSNLLQSVPFYCERPENSHAS